MLCIHGLSYLDITDRDEWAVQYCLCSQSMSDSMSRPPSSADSQLSLTFKLEGLKESDDTWYSRPIELNLTCNARSVSSIAALQLWTVTSHLAWTKMLHPQTCQKEGGEPLTVVAALLYSWLHSACAFNYRQRRGGPVQHVVPFRAGETM